MLSSHPHPKISRNRLRVGCVDKLNSRQRLHRSPCLPPSYGIYCDRERRVARHFGQIEHPLLAILIPTALGRFILGFHDRLFEIFLAKGPHQESGFARISLRILLNRAIACPARRCACPYRVRQPSKRSTRSSPCCQTLWLTCAPTRGSMLNPHKYASRSRKLTS